MSKLKKKAKAEADESYARALAAVEELHQHLAKVGPLAALKGMRTTIQLARSISAHVRDMHSFGVAYAALP